MATYTYNAANWLTQVSSPSSGVSYQYDDNGNLVNDGQFSYTYDSANRLTQLSGSNLTTQYEYNGDGVRVAQIVNGLRTDYVQDVALPLPQVLTTKQGATTAKYLRGLGLIGEQQGGGAWQYHLADALGSIRQVVDAQGQIQLSQRYDPFGGVESINGLTTSRYGFAGEEQDPDTEQLFLRARTYNPDTGRFLQQDSVLGSPTDPRTLHRYAYAFNNPINHTDPAGLMPFGLGGRTVNAQRVSPPATSYAATPPTQVGHLGPAASSGGFNGVNSGPPDRSVNGAGGQNWQSQSDPRARQQSQGHRPRNCGLADIGRGLWSTIVNGNLLEEAFDFAKHSRELALMLMPMEAWYLAFQLTTALNPYDYVMDIGSLLTGTDWWTGEELTDFDKAALMFGIFTGIGDELAKIGKKAMQVDKVRDVAKRGKGLWGSVKNLAAKGRSLLDDINQKGIREVAEETVNKLRKKWDSFVGGVAKVGKTDLPEGATKFADDFSSGSKPIFRKTSGGAQEVTRSQRLAELDAEMIGQMERSRKRSSVSDLLPDADELEAVAREGEKALEKYEDQLKRFAVAREGEKALKKYEDQLKRFDEIQQAKVANRRNRRAREVQRAREAGPLLDGTAIGVLGGMAVETGRQYFENLNSDMNPLEAALNLDPLSRDMGLAILAGAGIGASVGARRMVTGESLGMAIGQVGAGAGFNALATGLGSTNPGDLYIAAAIGGLAVPTTGFYEKRNPTGEALVNAGVGSLANSLQHGLTQYYNGKEITGQELLYNFSGGIGPGGVKAAMNRSPFRFGKADDFIVAVGASFTGGYLIPYVGSELFRN